MYDKICLYTPTQVGKRFSNIRAAIKLSTDSCFSLFILYFLEGKKYDAVYDEYVKSADANLYHKFKYL